MQGIWQSHVATLTVAFLFLGASSPLVHAQPATTIQLPVFGIAIDADGVIEVKEFADVDGSIRAKRLAAAKGAVPGSVAAVSPLRKVALSRLEKAIAARQAAGQPLEDAMIHLAGLSRVQFVFLYPDSQEVVIAGPAEGWVADASGRAIGIATGQPPMRLEDLAVALRAYAPGSANKPFVGCTIDPRQEGLARMAAFQKTVPATVPQAQREAIAARIAIGSRQALGSADVRVFGIAPETHLAQVLVEADYRMKRIGIGLEPPPVKMVTFLGALGSVRQLSLQRWWFQPDYDALRATDDGLAVEFVGPGVQLLGEDKAIGPDGKLLNSAAAPNPASELFTTSFTRKYPEIAAASPVYSQLRQGVDLLVAAAWLRKHDAYGRVNWKPRLLLDEATLPTKTAAVPKIRRSAKRDGDDQKFICASAVRLHHRMSALAGPIDDESASCLKCQENILQVKCFWERLL